MTMSQKTLQWGGVHYPKQTHPHHWRWRCQPCHWTRPLKVSAPETEASMESNPICNSPTAVAYSSHSDSPTMDLSELQGNAHLAINHMLLIKRSLDLERQWAIWDFKVSLHQWEAEAAAANERAKIAHSRKDLKARVKCAKAVMRAKYDYRVAVQEARAVRCSELKEAEAAYLGGPQWEHSCKVPPMHSTLQGTHEVYAWVGGTGLRCRE